MRVVIVGATGNVGTSLIEGLVGQPEVEAVVGIARREPAWNPPKTAWVRADVTADDLAAHFRGADAVVHLAWLFHPMRDPTVTWGTNVRGSMRVFEAAAAAGVGCLVYASSVAAYSPGPKDRAVDEAWPTHGWPTAAYPLEKAYVERVLDSFERQHPDMRVVRIRSGFIFKRQSASQQRRLFAGPLLPGSLVRPGLVPVVPDFPGLRFQVLHSADAAEAYRLALLRPVRGAFNLGADPVVDAGLLAQLFGARTVRLPLAAVRLGLSALFGVHAVPVPPGLLEVLVRLPLLDCSRARDELGWRPRHSASEALAEMLAGLRAGAGMPTPPLDPRAGGSGRAGEFASGLGARP